MAERLEKIAIDAFVEARGSLPSLFDTLVRGERYELVPGYMGEGENRRMVSAQIVWRPRYNLPFMKPAYQKPVVFVHESSTQAKVFPVEGSTYSGIGIGSAALSET